MADRTPQAPSSKRPQALRYYGWALFIGLLYIGLLLVPWVMTCAVYGNPQILLRAVPSYGQRKRPENLDDEIDYNYIRSIEVLNALATVLALPIISALLARAAVVFSQRRSPNQKLSVRQLFSLADRSWWSTASALQAFGLALLALAFVLPFLRSIIVAHGTVRVALDSSLYRWLPALGHSPSPGSLEHLDGTAVIAGTRLRLLATSGGVEAHLWPYCNDHHTESYYESACGTKYNPYDGDQSTLSRYWEDEDEISGYQRTYETNGSALMFASTLRPGANAGTERTFALGLKSGTKCSAVSPDEVRYQCGQGPPSFGGWRTSLVATNLSIEICLPGSSTTPWSVPDVNAFQSMNLTEHLYIGLHDLEAVNSDLGYWPQGCQSKTSGADCPSFIGNGTGLSLHCEANSSLGYFEPGTFSTRGVPSPFLSETPAEFRIPRPISSAFYDTKPRGPLATAAQALFGEGSWFGLAANTSTTDHDNASWSSILSTMCQMQPLQEADYFKRYHSGNGYPTAWNAYCEDLAYFEEWHIGKRGSMTYPGLLAQVARAWFRLLVAPWQARAILNTATFFANDALLSGALDLSGDVSSRYNTRISPILFNEGVEVTVPVPDLGRLIVITILVGAQAVLVLLLLAYIYSSPVWTETLDALAVSRIGVQLSNLDVFSTPRDRGVLGNVPPTRDQLKQLYYLDGLVGTTTHDRDMEMTTLPPPYAPREGQGEGGGGGAGADRLSEDTVQVANVARITDGPMPGYSPAGETESGGAAEGRSAASEAETAAAVSGEPVRPPLFLAVGGPGLISRRLRKGASLSVV